MALVGIDLGTTNSLIAIWKDGRVELLKNNLGHDMTPSVVGVDDDGSILVGEIAKQRRVSHPDYTAAEFKRNMGTDTKYVLGNREYLSEELSAILLKKLLTDGEERLGEKITEAVISVPAYFDDNQREATKRAAKFAGIEVKRLINEPSAAVLYKQWKRGEDREEGIHLVIDFGGGTLDVSVVDCFENIIEIIAVAGNNQLGGKDFDKAIAEDFCKKNGLNFELLKKSVRENILWTAENVKRALTENASVTMRVLIEDKTYEAEYNTNELLKISADILVQIKTVLNEALRGARIDVEEIVDIILVGGSCKMPAVQKYLSALFHREVSATEDGDYLVGYGAGMLTGIIGRDDEISEIVMTDVCPFSLGVGTVHSNNDRGEYMSVLIPKNSILPIAKSMNFSGVTPFQKKITLKVYQGEELYAFSNLFLGELSIDVVANSQGDTKIEVTFCYDINGVLEVTARDLNSDNTAETVIVNKNSKLTEAEIEKKRINIEQEARFEKNKEENRNILAWAQRLYAQADMAYKKILENIIIDFKKSVENNDMIMVRRKKRIILGQLLKLEMIINRDCFGNEDVITKLLADDSSEDDMEE